MLFVLPGPWRGRRSEQTDSLQCNVIVTSNVVALLPFRTHNTQHSPLTSLYHTFIIPHSYNSLSHHYHTSLLQLSITPFLSWFTLTTLHHTIFIITLSCNSLSHHFYHESLLKLSITSFLSYLTLTTPYHTIFIITLSYYSLSHHYHTSLYISLSHPWLSTDRYLYRRGRCQTPVRREKCEIRSSPGLVRPTCWCGAWRCRLSTPGYRWGSGCEGRRRGRPCGPGRPSRAPAGKGTERAGEVQGPPRARDPSGGDWDLLECWLCKL